MTIRADDGMPIVSKRRRSKRLVVYISKVVRRGVQVMLGFWKVALLQHSEWC